MTGRSQHDGQFRKWLALEQEAIWTYSHLGGRLDPIADPCRAAVAAHRKQRDRLLQAGAVASPPRLDYDVGQVSTRSEANRVAQSIEARIQAACIQVIRDGSPSTRRFAIAGLHQAAQAELTWGAQPRPYPGLA